MIIKATAEEPGHHGEVLLEELHRRLLYVENRLDWLEGEMMETQDLVKRVRNSHTISSLRAGIRALRRR